MQEEFILRGRYCRGSGGSVNGKATPNAVIANSWKFMPQHSH